MATAAAPGSANGPRPVSANETRGVIERFIERAEEPMLTEDGEGLFALRDGAYALEERGGRLVLQAWDEKRVLARRVIGVAAESRTRLSLRIERFGKRSGTVALIDRAAPSAQPLQRRAGRLELRESFRRFLRRNYTGFRIAELTTEAVLSSSLSPNFPRALLRSGVEGWAAIAAPDDALVADEVLSFGLIWLDYLRRREPACAIRGLILYLPAGHERTTCLRLRYLNQRAACYRAWAYTKDGVEYPLDPCDYGNLDTKVEPCHETSRPARALERDAPELLLEAQVRGSLRRLDPTLLAEPIYSQVPAFAATAHGLIDLLVADADGRLTVIELKASEDIHLPLQALDYWMRVRWHLERGDFASAGYFPGLELRNDPPRLLLVAPALMFHSSNETVLGYLSPDVRVERIGTGFPAEVAGRAAGRKRNRPLGVPRPMRLEWQKGLQVLFRASSPCR